MGAFNNAEFAAGRCLLDVFGMNCTGVDPGQNYSRAHALNHAGGKWIIRVQDHKPAGTHRFGERTFFLRNRVARSHKLDVCDPDIGDECRVGRGDARQSNDFTGMIYTNLPNGELIFPIGLQNRPREADVIVEIAFCFCDVIGAAENGSGKIFG